MMNKDSQKKATLNDLARYTNLSKATLSRYFNNPDYLSKKNLEIISNALKDLNYQGNKLAQVLARGKSEFIGILIPSFYYHFYSFFVNNILSTQEQNAYKFIVVLGNDNADKEEAYIQELLSYQVEGLIIFSHNSSSKYLSTLGIPVVAVEREDTYINSVNTDNASGAKITVEKLISDGCQILFHINNHVTPTIPSYGRIVGFENTCKSFNSKYELYLQPFSDNYNHNYSLLNDFYLRIKKEFPGIKKGIFVCNDTIANILINILIKNNESIPDEYEIIGFDNAPIAEQSIISLTTVNQNIPEMASYVIESINKQAQNKNAKNDDNNPVVTHIVCQPTLIIRDSTLQ